MIPRRSTEKPSAEVGELLRQIPIFSELEDAVIHQLASRCIARDFGTGRVLFTAGDTCRGLYVIQSGSPHLSHES